ncbi:MAG TPA: BA14K family protein [Pseudolabrys sp.]|nr:BA14K family protein [Pseudolabrys sp.]
MLVSIVGILLELDWLTKPKSDTRSPVQVATRTAAPTPQPNAKNKNADLTAANPKNPDIPQPVPKKQDAPQSEQAAHEAATKPQAAPQPPAVDPAPVQQQPAATTDAAPPVQRADGSTAGRALAHTVTLAYAEPAPAPAAAVAPTAAPVPPVAQTHTVAAAPNRCDVRACSSAYQSFRVSDCTYQPFEGPRRICENPPATTGRAAASQPRAEPRRQATYRTRDDEPDRDVVVRRARPIDADEGDADDEDDRGMERSRVIVIERPSSGPWDREDR